jgi:hypothetical protein
MDMSMRSFVSWVSLAECWNFLLRLAISQASAEGLERERERLHSTRKLVFL